MLSSFTMIQLIGLLIAESRQSLVELFMRMQSSSRMDLRLRSACFRWRFEVKMDKILPIIGLNLRMAHQRLTSVLVFQASQTSLS
ncbi:hypothetical protein BDW59DRAFT_103803 [Aspergillus cavernicola]|uniref:Secreted protein n=1 Tax=Aspergillus cavernicola TaxID=176166 RepID=A0ABR4I3D7_9EURO